MTRWKIILTAFVITFVLVSVGLPVYASSIDYQWWGDVTDYEKTDMQTAKALKIAFARGAIEGISCSKEDFPYSGLGADSFVEQVDLFYKNPANRAIPVVILIEFADLKFCGASSVEMESSLETARKIMSGIQ